MISEFDRAEAFKHRCLTDLGFICRHLFGFDYDESEEHKKKIRPGGIRRDGPHGRLTGMLDNWRQHPQMMVLMCRDSYKTSTAKGFVAQQILADINSNYAYAMEVQDLAADKVRDIRRLVTLPKVQAVFGTKKGFPWKTDFWSLGGRDPTLPEDNVNCSAVGIREGYAGPHLKGCVIDDAVTEESLKSDTGLEQAIIFLEKIVPVIEPGGWILIIGTLYHQLDLYHHVMDTPKIRELFQILKEPCGMRMVRNEHGQWDLEGEPAFPHLGEKFLRKQFALMRPDKFAKNYTLEILPSTDVTFERENFQVIPRWEHWMEDNYGYILTDVATSSEKPGCQSAILMVSLDYKDHAYLHDMMLGHWPQPSTFIENFMRMYEKWAHRFVLKGGTFEQQALTQSYQRGIEAEMDRRRIRNFNTIPITRGRSEDNKDERIRNLEPRFSGRRFWVVDEDMPKSVMDVGEKIVLWDPEGFNDDKGRVWADGELVRQFIFHPRYGKKDAADALADIDQIDKKGCRYCPPPPMRHGSKPKGGILFPAGMRVPATMSVNGIPRVVDISAQATMGGRQDWFEQKLAQLQGASLSRFARNYPSNGHGRRR